MRVLLYGPRPRLLGGGEHYFAGYARRLGEHVDLEVAYVGEEAALAGRRFDVLHAMTFVPRAARLARERARAFVTTFHVSPLQHAGNGFRSGRRGVFRLAQAAVYANELARCATYLARADRVIAVSPSTARGLVRTWPPAAPKVVVVENSVDTAVFRPTGGREGYGLYAGRVEEVKGAHLAVEAFRRLGLPLRIAGTGRHLPAVRAAAAGADVQVVGQVPRDRLVELYQQANVVVAPSWLEGCPYVILEALACGTPVVSTRCFECSPPLRDAIAWVPRGDAEALAETVRSLWDTKTPARGTELRAAVEHHNTWAHAVSAVLAAYEAALRARAA